MKEKETFQISIEYGKNQWLSDEIGSGEIKEVMDLLIKAVSGELNYFLMENEYGKSVFFGKEVLTKSIITIL